MTKLNDIDYQLQFPTYTRATPRIPKVDEKKKLERTMRAPDYVPPKWTPDRPEANDHLKYKSRGT